MNKRIPLLLLPLLISGAAAADDHDETEPEVRRYTVEMIIFSYADNVSVGSEVFVPDLPPVEEMLLDGSSQEDIPQPIEGQPPPADTEPAVNNDVRAYELAMLAEKDFTLQEVFEHLRRLDAYQPLMHFGWTQATYPDEQSVTRPLSSFASPPEGLSGDLTLYLSRYLHLAINLQLDAPANGKRTFGIESPSAYPVRYRITENRIFRSGELRYFDHPKFGAVARITRAEKADADVGNTELLGYDGE